MVDCLSHSIRRMNGRSLEYWTLVLCAAVVACRSKKQE
jgi:hypothetical protein